MDKEIEILSKWGLALEALIQEAEENKSDNTSPLQKVIQQAYLKNRWFTPEMSLKALTSIASMLRKDDLLKWTAPYQSLLTHQHSIDEISIIAAGNIPAVAFHDILCVLITGFKAQVKLSADDAILIPFLISVLTEIDPSMKDKIRFTERITEPQAVIATGSNNTARYFDYYFGKYPHVIRKNRNGIAVLTGKESDQELAALGDDIFSYFGLGCRNVSHIFIPEGYNLSTLFINLQHFSWVMNVQKYMNNYDYHHALFLLGNEKFLTNNFLIVKEASSYSSPVSVLHYSEYNDINTVEEKLLADSSAIQCRVGVDGLPFGTTQNPAVWDYADNVDTLDWLLKL